MSPSHGHLIRVLVGSLLLQLCDAIKAKGSLPAIIEVNAAKGHPNPIPTSLQPLKLWCQAIDDQGRPLPLISAQFRSKSNAYPATLSPDKTNASISIEAAQSSEAGKWSCDLHSGYGNITGIIDVFVRPVIKHNGNVRVDEKDGSKFYLEISGHTVTVGDNVTLFCPVYGHPPPVVSWRKGGKIIPASPSNSYALIFPSTTDADEGVYTCVGTNTIHQNGRPKQHSVTIDQHLRIKSKLAWLVPFLIILAILITLAAVIIFCECRRKKQTRELKPQEDD
ncbi:unnamed protein product [Bursaphelenchus xylophilus]|nr:unnamed protein product [Bursaphelenchus xylophilus]CAG9086415.1 unnamed protein product [Bursaphelenchus xylophilus]